MLPRFEIVARLRPVDLVAPRHTLLEAEGDVDASLPLPAPYAAVEANVSGPARLTLTAGGRTVCAVLEDDRAWLEIDGDRHRSRRRGRLERPAEALALLVTARQATVLTRSGETWTARARHDLHDADRRDVYDEGWAASLRVRTQGCRSVRAGAFGQVGLRDVRFVTDASGDAVTDDHGRLLLTATHAGPGGFTTGRTGVWAYDHDAVSLHHLSDLYFRRPDVPGVYGDHATHLVRDGDSWLVATSTWGDFDRRPGTLRVTLARTTADVLTGHHVLDTEELPLPVGSRRSVAVWDPHLVHDGERWMVGFVSATKFFRFHPELAAGPTLDALQWRASASGRTATEGTTLVRLGDEWRVLASDGRDNPRAHRGGWPVFDLDLAPVGRLDAAYPTNIPWPTIAQRPDGSWLMVTFNGARWGGDVLPYGTHGQVVVQRTG